MLDILFDLPMSFLKGSASITSLPVAAPNSLQKIYFWFGEPISTEEYGGDADNTEFAKEVRDKTKAAIEKGIRELQAKQVADPDPRQPTLVSLCRVYDPGFLLKLARNKKRNVEV